MIYEDLINKLVKQGKTYRQAEGIAKSVLSSKYGEKGKLNKLGNERSFMSSDERKIDRISKATGIAKNHYYIVGGKPRIKPLYRKKK